MIKLEQTVKRFGEFAALNGADMEIPAGTAFGLLGSNGAGKSTILRLISGVYRPDSGRVTIDGRDVYDDPAVMEKVFFINDETVQFGSMTLGDLKRFYSGFSTRSCSTGCARLLICRKSAALTPFQRA